MIIQKLRNRRKACTAAALVAYGLFVLGCAVLISLPGFLYYFFWEKASWAISTLTGFLLGSFALSLLEVLGTLAKAVRRLFRGPAGREDAKAKADAAPRDEGGGAESA